MRWIACVVLAITTVALGQTGDWTSDFHPYRLQLQLHRPSKGKVAIDLSQQQVADALQSIAIDEIEPRSLALDRAVLKVPGAGEAVGRFVLLPKGAPLAIDGDFAAIGSQKQSPWSGWNPAEMTMQREAIAGQNRSAIAIRKSQITNTKLSQMVPLNKGGLYLLEYYVWSDTSEYTIAVDLYNSAKHYFPKLTGSYVPALTERGQWVHVRALRYADVSEAELRIENVFIGECRIAGMRLQEVEWKGTADLPADTDRLDVYISALGGHYAVQPDDTLLATTAGARVGVKSMAAQRADLNPAGVLVDGGPVRAWTVPSYLPLIADRIAATVPAQRIESAAISLLRGGAATQVIALDSQTPLVRITRAECDLPVEVRFERIAEVPLYDGPITKGKKVGSRFDALMPIDSSLIPPATQGIHLVAVTLTACADAPAGRHSGTIRLTVQTQEPNTAIIEIPINLEVFPYRIRPMRHFGTLFGTIPFSMRVSSDAGLMRPGVSNGEFYGRDDAQDALAKAYVHRMADYFVAPENPPMRMPTCKVTHRGSDQPPLLDDWDFSSMDEAIDEFLIGRDMPWFMIARTNGKLMNSIYLPNGETYSFDDGGSAPRWNRLSRTAFFQLVGSYYEAMAAHLESRGVLDRAVFVVDESMPETFDLIAEYIAAVRAQPNARHIRFGNTSDKTSFYTRLKPDGSLLFDGLIDMPMNGNDELLNYYEPALTNRLKQPGRVQWVYYVETTHLSLDHAGLSTILTPLKLKAFGAEGWYCWAAVLWTWPAVHSEERGPRWALGPALNPWMNPFYHHGPGAMALFYPPDPRGLSPVPTDVLVPSYRMALIRDGIQIRALLEVLEAGRDDDGVAIAVDADRLQAVQADVQSLWSGHPTQWHLSYARTARALAGLYAAFRSAD